MTEYELHALIAEHIGFTFDNFETWAGITAAMLLAGHYGRSTIGPLLRRIIIASYITAGTLIVSNLVQLSYAIEKYREQLFLLEAMDYPFNPITNWVSGIASFAILVVGTIAATYYFARVTTQDKGAAN